MSGTETPNAHKGGWEFFPHDADIGIRGWGRTQAEAFEQAGHALTAIVTNAKIESKLSIKVGCEAANIELLFVEWLNCVIYEMAVRSMVFARFAVRIQDGRLQATLWGEPIDVDRHAPACEPKGATYTSLNVTKTANGLWSAACIVDV